MVSLDHVEEQLKRIGCDFQFWGRSEVRQLPNILMPEETIKQCVNGRYEGGFAMLCVTDHRLLLVDHKPMFLGLEDVRFDMIVEIDYSSRLLDGVIHVVTPTRKLTFMSWSQTRLRKLLNYTQRRIMEIRQQHIPAQNQQGAPQPQVTASVMGSLAMQPPVDPSTNPFIPPVLRRTLPMNPYTKTPLLMRRQRYPKFY